MQRESAGCSVSLYYTGLWANKARALYTEESEKLDHPSVHQQSETGRTRKPCSQNVPAQQPPTTMELVTSPLSKLSL